MATDELQLDLECLSEKATELGPQMVDDLSQPFTPRWTTPRENFHSRYGEVVKKLHVEDKSEMSLRAHVYTSGLAKFFLRGAKGEPNICLTDSDGRTYETRLHTTQVRYSMGPMGIGERVYDREGLANWRAVINGDFQQQLPNGWESAQLSVVLPLPVRRVQ